jgi:hypothetical protein
MERRLQEYFLFEFVKTKQYSTFALAFEASVSQVPGKARE